MAANGATTPSETRARQAQAWALRNALTDAGEAVLTTAAIGDTDKVAAVATARLTAIRERFGDDIFRIMPPGLNNHEEDHGES